MPALQMIRHEPVERDSWDGKGEGEGFGTDVQVKSNLHELGFEVAVRDIEPDCALCLPLHAPIARGDIVLQLLNVRACDSKTHVCIGIAHSTPLNLSEGKISSHTAIVLSKGVLFQVTSGFRTLRISLPQVKF